MANKQSSSVLESPHGSEQKRSRPQNSEIGDKLIDLLAANYVLYVKTQHFHWNVTGPLFRSHHLMFEDQYKAMQLEIDDVAERIRTLNYPVPASMQEFVKRSNIEDSAEIPVAEEMVRILKDSHETIIADAKALIPVLEDAGDDATVDMVVEFIETHEKMLWMLNSSL